MSTITKEQLRERAREKVKSLEFSIKQTAFADSRAELEEELELARIALASLEAEAVAYSLIFRNMDGVLNDYVNANTTFSTIEKAQAYGKGGSYVEQNDGSLQWVSDPSLDPVVVPLYTAPPAPVSDSLLSELLGIAKRAADEADECAHSEFSDDSMEHSAAIADWERRAAMLQGGKS